MGEGESGGCGRGRRDWVVEIDSEVENLKTLNTRERDAHRRHAIYRVPKFFLRYEKHIQAYSPEMVSMGPYHHGEEQLLPMEDHKRRALCRFLVRAQRSVSVYREAMRGVVQELMDSYKDLENEWKDDEERFLQVMIFDGCFMIEVLRAVGGPAQCGYDENDPIFSRHGVVSIMPRIRRDMLMIENQIPLLVLKKLLSVEQGVVDDQDERKQRSLNQTVNNMVLKFFVPEEAKDTERTTEPPSSATAELDEVELGLHALDVARKSMIKDIKGRKRGRPAGRCDVILPATELQEAGIKFRKSGTPSLKDIHFSRGYLHTTLSLPQLEVDDATESKFLNLMAFENLHARSGKEVCSYVCFMDSIIDSEKDVSLLSRNGIIKNFVGTDQAVADLFNGLSHDISVDPAADLFVVHKSVIDHCSHPTRRLMANFRRGWDKYFYSPWVLVSSVGATVALVMTGMQVAYAMLEFHTKTSKS